MGGALGLRAARCEPFGGRLSGAAREQPATVAVGPARTVGGVLWGPRGTRTANGRGVRPLGSGTRLEPSSADRPHLGWAYAVVAVWLPTPRRFTVQNLMRRVFSGHRNDCNCRQPIEKIGGASRDRTDDLIVANDALSQLSYSPIPRRVCFF
jgi:hypothetical protein